MAHVLKKCGCRPLAAISSRARRVAGPVSSFHAPFKCPGASTSVFKTPKSLSAPATSPRPTDDTARECTASASRWNGSLGVDWKDRIFGTLPYLLPFINAYAYGRYLFYQYPMFAAMVAPFMPLIQVYFGVPFASLIAFFGVYIGVVANTNLSHFIRLNAMQAILLDILLIVPRLIEQLLGRPSEAFTQFYITFNSCVWLFIAGAVVYAVYSCFTGVIPRLPFITDAADQQIR